MIGTSQHNHSSMDHHNKQLTGSGGGSSSQIVSSHHTHHQHLVNHRTSNANQLHNDDDDYQDDNGMRVGNNYQAEIPQFIAYAPAPEYYEEEKAIRVWSPYNKIPDHVLEEYILKAKEKYYYNTEQALGMLAWHKFDLNRAYADLPNFVPYPSEWSVEDKVLFEQAFQFHEKQFFKIKQMLPDKTMANLINYYYSWKKIRSRASLMERQTRRFAARKAADSNGPSDEEGEGDENDNDQTTKQLKQEANSNDIGNDGPNENEQNEDSFQKDCSCEEKGIEEPEISCCICSKELRTHGETHAIIIDGLVDNFCPSCYTDWKASGRKVVTETELGDCFYHPLGEPKKILFSYQDVKQLVEGIPEAGDLMLRQIDCQVQDVKRNIQTKKQTFSQIQEKIRPIADQISDLNIDEFLDILPEYRPCKEWVTEEIQLVIQGLQRYGLDYNAISDIVRTKSPDHIRTFFVSQKDRLDLQRLIDEFDASQGVLKKEQQILLQDSQDA